MKRCLSSLWGALAFEESVSMQSHSFKKAAVLANAIKFSFIASFNYSLEHPIDMTCQ